MAHSAQVMTPDSANKTTPAAYVSFRTFLSSIEALEHGLPKRLDRTIWRSQSGVVQSQIMMALRFFDLLDEDDRPTTALQRLVDSGQEKRREQISALLHHAYHDIIEHDLTKMTPKMLDDAMEQYHVNGDTKRKAVSFFLQAARYAELPMHPLLQGTIRTRRPRRAKPREDEPNGRFVTPPSSPETPSTPPRVIELTSGGKITLTIDVDVFSMSAEDRKFVFDLIDKLQDYEKSKTQAGMA